MQKVFSFIKSKREGKKSKSEKNVSTKQLIEESGDDDEVIRNVRDNNSTDDLSEPDDEIETGSITDNFRNLLFILPLALISTLF